MSLLKVLVVDDEKEARELLLHYLQPWWHTMEISEASNGLAALDALSRQEPDIIFLDIKMPELSGIEVLERKDRSVTPAVIFTTAYDEYALPAFDFDLFLNRHHDVEDFVLHAKTLDALHQVALDRVLIA